MTWTDIRICGTDHLSIFESEEILWNKKQGMNPKWHLFRKRGEAQWGTRYIENKPEGKICPQE